MALRIFFMVCNEDRTRAFLDDFSDRKKKDTGFGIEQSGLCLARTEVAQSWPSAG